MVFSEIFKLPRKKNRAGRGKPRPALFFNHPYRAPKAALPLKACIPSDKHLKIPHRKHRQNRTAHSPNKPFSESCCKQRTHSRNNDSKQRLPANKNPLHSHLPSSRRRHLLIADIFHILLFSRGPHHKIINTAAKLLLRRPHGKRRVAVKGRAYRHRDARTLEKAEKSAAAAIKSSPWRPPAHPASQDIGKKSRETAGFRCKTATHAPPDRSQHSSFRSTAFPRRK